jgi:5-methylcytosine-specific restriction endonuclease McrA
MRDRRWKSGVRSVAKRRLANLVAKYGGKCFYCGVAIVCESAIPEDRRIHKTAHMVTFKSESGDVRREYFATVDHVKPIASFAPGTKREVINAASNLVPACSKCNGRKAREVRPAVIPCRGCGALIRKRKFCRTCFRKLPASVVMAMKRT